MAQVLTEDEQDPPSTDLREIFSYIAMADQAFAWIHEGRPLTVGLLADLQRTLVRHTASENQWAGRLRGDQVVIGRRQDAARNEVPVKAARFVPVPPGLDLEARVRDLVEWMSTDRRNDMDPVVAAAMAHYQFETLHPFHDGNGRIGRLLIILHLMITGVLSEPTLTVSEWFEARRAEYFDRLLAVSRQGDWNAWVDFFASGLDASAIASHQQMLDLLDVQAELHERVRSSNLRSENANKLVDLAVARPSFTARQVEHELGISYGRANGLISQLVKLGLLQSVHASVTRDRRFQSPAVMQVLLRT